MVAERTSQVNMVAKSKSQKKEIIIIIMVHR